MLRTTKTLLLLTTLSVSASMQADQSDENETPGVLDRPLPAADAGDSEDLQQTVQEELAEEQEVLESLDRPELTELAENGERAAQITLAESFAKEASLLSFAPAAANDALSDAVRWYSQAASRGFPGAPSLDYARVQFYPIRAQREP